MSNLPMAEGTVAARLVGAHVDDVPLADLAAAMGRPAVSDVLRVYNNAGTQHFADSAQAQITIFDSVASAAGGWGQDCFGGTFLTWDATTRYMTFLKTGLYAITANVDFAGPLASGYVLMGVSKVSGPYLGISNPNVEVNLTSAQEQGNPGVAGLLFGMLLASAGDVWKFTAYPFFTPGAAGADLTYCDMEVRAVTGIG